MFLVHVIIYLLYRTNALYCSCPLCHFELILFLFRRWIKSVLPYQRSHLLLPHIHKMFQRIVTMTFLLVSKLLLLVFYIVKNVDSSWHFLVMKTPEVIRYRNIPEIFWTFALIVIILWVKSAQKDTPPLRPLFLALLLACINSESISLVSSLHLNKSAKRWINWKLNVKIQKI